MQSAVMPSNFFRMNENDLSASHCQTETFFVTVNWFLSFFLCEFSGRIYDSVSVAHWCQRDHLTDRKKVKTHAIDKVCKHSNVHKFTYIQIYFISYEYAYHKILTKGNTGVEADTSSYYSLLLLICHGPPSWIAWQLLFYVSALLMLQALGCPHQIISHNLSPKITCLRSLLMP